MAIVQLMQVPQWLLSSVSAGTAVIDGAMVKDAISGQILAHLQPSSRLGQLVLDGALGGPLTPVSTLSGLVQNVQLFKLQEAVDAVRAVASLGAAAAVLNLGVSIGGFALVLDGLRRTRQAVDTLRPQVDSLARHQDAEFAGRAKSHLLRAEQAFELRSDEERQRYWREADTALGELVHLCLERLAGEGLSLQSNSRQEAGEVAALLAQPVVIDHLRWALLLNAALSELSLCRDEPGQAAQTAARSVAWCSGLPQEAAPLAKVRLAGRAVAPSVVQQVVAESGTMARLIRGSAESAASRRQLANWLHERGACTSHGVFAIRQEPAASALAWTTLEPPST